MSTFLFGSNLSRLYPYIFLVIVGLLVILAYQSGLSGPFLFDDYGTLAALGEMGGVSSGASYWAFISSGAAGPSGRPIALATFLLDGTNWPAEPWPFKRTNLVLHLINGVALCLVAVKLLGFVSRYKANRSQALWVGVVVASLWLCHPFLVSTTLYVVQRMAQLSLFFCLVGMYGYLYARGVILTSNPVKAYLIMTASVLVGAGGAVLSKEDGALLFFYIALIEYTVVTYGGVTTSRLSRIWTLVFVWLPIIGIILFVAKIVVGPQFFEESIGRDFSPYERLLTESRILFHYLYHWIIPKHLTSGLFNDSIVLSTGLFAPALTFFAVLGHCLVVLLLIAYRKVFPLLAMSILFFYASHILESTVLSLELYFEHRNYKATMFLFMPLVVLSFDRLGGRKALQYCSFVILGLVFFTYLAADIWSSNSRLMMAWSKKSPYSIRAQQQASIALYNDGEKAEAVRLLKEAMVRNPNSIELALSNVLLGCRYNGVTLKETDQLLMLSQRAVFDMRVFDLYDSVIDFLLTKTCGYFSTEVAQEMLLVLSRSASADKPSGGEVSQIRYLQGKLFLGVGDYGAAMQAFRESLSIRPDANYAMVMAAMLASKGYFDSALSLSTEAKRYIGLNGAAVLDSGFKLAQIEEFERQVRLDMSVQYLK